MQLKIHREAVYNCNQRFTTLNDAFAVTGY